MLQSSSNAHWKSITTCDPRRQRYSSIRSSPHKLLRFPVPCLLSKRTPLWMLWLPLDEIRCQAYLPLSKESTCFVSLIIVED